MNLWGKSLWLRQLLFPAVALFFLSCEDPNSLLGFRNPSFTNITTDRSATELSGVMQPYHSIVPASGLRYIQTRSTLMTKIDLKDFYAFAPASPGSAYSVNRIVFRSDKIKLRIYYTRPTGIKTP